MTWRVGGLLVLVGAIAAAAGFVWMATRKTEPEEHIVFAVQFSNYSPSEIDSLWRIREDAEARVAELNRGRNGRWAGWAVVELVVQ